jgi:hypothetical protein
MLFLYKEVDLSIYHPLANDNSNWRMAVCSIMVIIVIIIKYIMAYEISDQP